MIILVGSNKGGSGKTTVSCNLAVAIAKNNNSYDVCLVDADRQGSAARWHQERENSEITPVITLVQKYDNLTKTLQTLNEKFTHVIVDVAGRNSREMITAATVADMIIAPHQCSQLDLDTLGELQEQMVRVLDLNPDLEIFIYQTMASTNVQVIEAERRDFESYVSEFPEFTPLKASGRYRKIYRDVMSEGQSVLEAHNKHAVEEVSDLFHEVLGNG